MNHDPTQTEREKYERIWKLKSYRDSSPGERLVSLACEHFGKEPASIIDFGCGTGRASLQFLDRGYGAVGVDIADNCLDEEARRRLPFVEATLWELPPLRGQFGFCVDVMEHIPEDHVHSSLLEMWVAVEDSLFFRIATEPHMFHGEELHPTIFTREEWEEVLCGIWKRVLEIPVHNWDGAKGVCFLCAP